MYIYIESLLPIIKILFSVEGKDLCIGVWDTAGSERYEAMSRMYYRNAKVCTYLMSGDYVFCSAPNTSRERTNIAITGSEF